MANIRYDSLQVTEGTYIPEAGKSYPQDDPHARLKPLKRTHEEKIDEHYPYLDDSFHTRWRIFWAYVFILYLSLGTYLYLCMGLRVHGRKNLRKYRKQLKDGFITLSNHVYFLDCPAVLIATRAPHTTKIPMFAPNFSTGVSYFLHVVGCIPIPEDNFEAMKKFNAAFDTFHERKYRFHIFPEAARWDYYKPLRPFSKGAFSMAYKYNMPLVPCCINFRPRTGIYRLFGAKDKPLISVEIGEPVFPDTTQPRRTEVQRLLHESRQRILKLLGITHNTWDEEYTPNS
jgi:1-acyl-sn-glycerol-3-phosphate acyltransferase